MGQKNFIMVSLGCAKNLVDTEKIAGLLCHEGYIPTAELAHADVAIINTCAFLQEARQESLQEIARISRKKNNLSGRSLKIIVTGCLSRYYDEQKIKNLLPEVDKTFSPGDYDSIPLYLNSASSQSKDCLHHQRQYGENRLLTASPHSVYLKIADGCDNRCAYCLIPFLRGPLRSRKMNDVLAEAKVLQELGAREINLVAQDTTAYGLELYGKKMLGKLLRQLCKIQGIDWMRILYTHPAHVDDELIEIVAAEPRICKYMDIPIQHISNPILQRMGRRTTREEIVSLYEKIRKTIPDVTLRTTVMVGYPGETEEDFLELLSFLRDYPFERLGAFVFSKEKGTAAFMEKRHIPLELAKERYNLVMQQQKLISRKFNRDLLGRYREVLIDTVKPGKLTSRLSSQAPDIDGKVFVSTSGGAFAAGQLLTVRITGTGAYNLLASEKGN